MKLLVLAFTIWIGTLSIAVADPNDKISDLVKGFSAEDLKCRGGPADDPNAKKACAARNVYHQKLRDAGLCYGALKNSGYTRQWYTCADHTPDDVATNASVFGDLMAIADTCSWPILPVQKALTRYLETIKASPEDRSKLEDITSEERAFYQSRYPHQNCANVRDWYDIATSEKVASGDLATFLYQLHPTNHHADGKREKAQSFAIVISR
jgi:hypothetical protein